jgi:hypothetical protein
MLHETISKRHIVMCIEQYIVSSYSSRRDVAVSSICTAMLSAAQRLVEAVAYKKKVCICRLHNV